MNELEQREWIIPLIYAECDAAFAAYSPELRRVGLVFNRLFRTATAGSSVYSLKFNLNGKSQTLGNIRFRQVGSETLARVSPATQPIHPDTTLLILNAILRNFWKWHQTETHRLTLVPSVLNLTSDLSEALQSIPESVTEPKSGDSMDAWLDWREREQQRTGRRISLPYIAREGNFKIDTLKKKSAARRHEKTEETEDRNE